MCGECAQYNINSYNLYTKNNSLPSSSSYIQSYIHKSIHIYHSIYHLKEWDSKENILECNVVRALEDLSLSNVVQILVEISFKSLQNKT